MARAADDSHHPQTKRVSLTKSDCWRGCPSTAALWVIGKRKDSFPASRSAGAAFMTGQACKALSPPATARRTVLSNAIGRCTSRVTLSCHCYLGASTVADVMQPLTHHPQFSFGQLGQFVDDFRRAHGPKVNSSDHACQVEIRVTSASVFIRVHPCDQVKAAPESNVSV